MHRRRDAKSKPTAGGVSDLLGYIPPHSLEAEQATIGCILVKPEMFAIIGDRLDSNHFYIKKHQHIFKAITDIFNAGHTIDIVTVHDLIKSREQSEMVGGLQYLSGLTEAAIDIGIVEEYARLVLEKSILRNMAQAGLQINSLARGEVVDFEETIDKAERMVFELGRLKTSSPYSNLGEIMSLEIDLAEMRSRNDGPPPGVKTGIKSLDYAIPGGFQITDFIVIASRPSMGKTSLMMEIAMACAINQNLPVLILSLEMSKEMLAQRALCSYARINSAKLRTGDLNQDEWQRLTVKAGRFCQADIFIEDTTSCTVNHARGVARRFSHQFGQPGLILVDYLQLMRDPRFVNNRYQEISEIARGLKNMAREFKCPVVALSQLSKGVEKRENKRPMLSDLLESGSIEAEADIVLFLYREAYYKMKEMISPDQAKPDQNAMEETEIIIGKYRNGATGMVKVGFLPEYAKFVANGLSNRDDIPGQPLKPGQTGF